MIRNLFVGVLAATIVGSIMVPAYAGDPVPANPAPESADVNKEKRESIIARQNAKRKEMHDARLREHLAKRGVVLATPAPKDANEVVPGPETPSAASVRPGSKPTGRPLERPTRPKAASSAPAPSTPQPASNGQ